jgi:hypothetical protein
LSDEYSTKTAASTGLRRFAGRWRRCRSIRQERIALPAGEAELGEVDLSLGAGLRLEADQRLRGWLGALARYIGSELADSAGVPDRLQFIEEPRGGELRVELQASMNNSH